MEARATQKYIRVSPQKARLVVDLIRGKNVGDALSTLTYTKKRVTQAVEKVLRSAIANAEDLKEHKKEYNGLRTDRLVIKEALAQTASTLRRFTPKARGSAGPILKRNCHIKIVLSDE